MITTLLIFPVIICIILFFNKIKALNNFLLMIYAIMHIIISFCYVFKLTNSSTKYFEVDGLNLIFLAILSIIFLAVTVYNLGYTKNKNFTYIELRNYTISTILFVFAMTGGILSTNLGIAWVFIEATTLASGYLIYFNKTKHAIEATWKYIFMCSIGIALAFVGIILISIATGNTNSLQYSDLYNVAKSVDIFWLKLAFVFILFGMGTKTGLAPVHFWLPDAHAQAPSPISGLLSASLLNCAFLIILRIYKLMILADCMNFANILLFTMGFLSVFVTAVFLYHINNYKRMLAYSSIENMGILTIGAALGGFGLYASMLHMIGHSLIKAAFFLTSGNILTLFKSKKIRSASGIFKIDSKTAWLWIISGFCIIATPPSVLFISEFLIAKQMLIEKKYFMLIVFLLLLTIILYGVIKVVIKMTFGDGREDKLEIAKQNIKKIHFSMYFPQAILLIFAVILGLYIPDFLDTIIKSAIIGF